MKDGVVVQVCLALLTRARMRPFACAFGELHEVLDGNRCVFLKQTTDNRPLRGFKRGICAGLTGHEKSFLNVMNSGLRSTRLGSQVRIACLDCMASMQFVRSRSRSNSPPQAGDSATV